MVHFEISGTPNMLLLDIIKCVHSHTGTNLASTFAKVLKDFSISDKVSQIVKKMHLISADPIPPDTYNHLQ